MFNYKYRFQLILIIFILIIKSSLSQKLTQELLGGWNEKDLSENDSDYLLTLKSLESYLLNQGYSLDETDIIPFGFFKQIVNGINYRILCAIKEKSSKTPTIFDIIFHKNNNNEINMLNAKNPEYTSLKLSEKEKKQIENAIIKFYFEKIYTIKEWEIQYEYHNLDGLNQYRIYDLVAKLNNKDETVNKRMIMVYRNDKTFKVETELNEN